MFEEPVDHVLVRSGLCSLRSAKNFIKNNEVFVNQSRIEGRDFLFDSEKDVLSVNGRKVSVSPHIYLMMNKPLGSVCSRKSDSHKTVYDFLPESIKNLPEFNLLHTVGRLDSETSGLLFFTTNGKLSDYLTRPETHVEKEYEAVLRDSVDKTRQLEMIKAFSSGVFCEAEKKAQAFTSKPSKLEFLSENKARLKISEGKFHQVRRMFSSMENEVVELKRTAIGKIRLPEKLEAGSVMTFSPSLI